MRAGLGKRVHGFPRAAAATTGCGRRATGGGQARPGASAGLQRPFCLAGPARASWAVRGGPPAADALLALEAQVHDGQVVHCHMRAHPFRGHAQNVAGRAAHTGEPRSGLGYNHRPAPTPGSRPGDMFEKSWSRSRSGAPRIGACKLFSWRSTAAMEQKAALVAAAAEGSKLLTAVTELMAKKDVAMGDLLQSMEPVKGQEGKVDESSDAVEALQTDLDKQVKALRAQIETLKSQAAALPDEGAAAAGRAAAQPKPAEAEHQVTATRTASAAAAAAAAPPVAGGDSQLDRGDRDEIADLRASLQSVTMREKERLEALQSQLEAARHELSECRSGRRIEQSNLVAAESQATQLRTALACAEEDMKALRDALDQELLRGHRLQSRLMELDHTLHSHSLRGQFEDDPKSRAHAAPGKSRAGADSTAAAPSLEDVAFDDYLSSLRKDGGGGGGRGGRGKSRPGSAKLGKGGGARAAGDRQRPVSAGGNARAQKDDGHVWWGRDGDGGEAGGGGYRGSSAMDVVISNRQAYVPTDALRQDDRPKRVPSIPSASSTHATGMSASGASSTQSSAPRHTNGSLSGGAETSAPLANLRGNGAPDGSSLAHLRANVVSGHVTKTSHLELKVEYCGRKSFSVRHKVLSLPSSHTCSRSRACVRMCVRACVRKCVLTPPLARSPTRLLLGSRVHALVSVHACVHTRKRLGPCSLPWPFKPRTVTARRYQVLSEKHTQFGVYCLEVTTRHYQVLSEKQLEQHAI